jgi:predicted ATP-grasp superfamily ATP-dependent carboligase
VSWVNGLAAIRSLGRAGIGVIALDHRQGALGFRSRYAVPLRCPDPVADEPGFVAFLGALASELRRAAPVLPTHDPYLNAIARNAAALGGRLLCPFPSWELLERLQRERARELGVATPRTVDEPTDELGFPVLVKPSDPVGFRRAFGRQAFRCETRAELDAAYARARPYDPLVQEWVPGGDDALYTLGSFLDADGVARGVFCGRKLRQVPPGIGTCRVGEALDVPDVVEQGLALLRGIGFAGVSQVEFKRDPRDGVYRLMEINPRLWQWHGLAAACGVDLPRIAYWDALGARLPEAVADGCRRRWAITLQRGARPVLVRPPYVDAVLARDDPRPAIVQLVRVALGAVR